MYLERTAPSDIEATGREIALGNTLTVRETASGFTAAAFKQWRQPIHRDGIRYAESSDLTILSLMRDGRTGFEFHTTQWNVGFFSREVILDCGYVCIRLLRQGDVMTHYATDMRSASEAFAEFAERLPDSLVTAHVQTAQSSLPEGDVFGGISKKTAAYIGEVLRTHPLVSPAAREAFGQNLALPLPAGGEGDVLDKHKPDLLH